MTLRGDSDGTSYKSTISVSRFKYQAYIGDWIFVQVLMKWSSHYWKIISDVLSESQSLCGSLLMEAQMNLANIALVKCDTSRALRLYSQVKTPQAAWNQSQVKSIVGCMLHSTIFASVSDLSVIGRKRGSGYIQKYFNAYFKPN